ncbi:FAD-dependent oxidoreductase [Pectobacteriaceae bacterium CE70]|nr:FAD-dependent oxidoreductase [Pectobacteriaceae bacterium C52]WJV68288.1 FAD-dependent oxidoreductase [Pectobacteriaceae bacterium CE70]WJY12218.1 FAD-dependent oxidoreductase [Pectobacteriaceae bacterium C80]
MKYKNNSKEKRLLPALSIIAGCIMTFTVMGSAYADGTSAIVAGSYTASAQGKDSEVKVTVDVDKKGKISNVAVDASKETPELGGVAGPEVGKAIVDYQSLDVDGITGATETSNAVKRATEAALLQAGVDISAYKKKVVKSTGANEETTTDIVVIGGGASGTAAALAAAEKGVKVIVLEKAPAVGGAGKLASGLFAVESSLEKAKKINFTTDELYKRLMDYNHYLSNAALTREVINKSGSTISWLQKYGVETYLSDKNPQQAQNKDPIRWQIYHHYKDTGAAFKNMYAHFEQMGGKLFTRTTGNSLIKNEKGDVVGVIATKADGGKLSVHAKAVILATGGFGGNKKMLSDVMLTPNISLLSWANSGEGVKMAWEAGAAKWNLQSALLHANKLVGVDAQKGSGFNDSPLIRLLKSPLLWVDVTGNRFADEGLVYDTAYWSNATYSVGGSYFIIVDTPTLQAFSKGKLPFDISGAGAPNPTQPGDFVALSEGGVKSGNIIKGDTLEELAKNTGMAPEKLTATIARYNMAVSSKKDVQFLKSGRYLVFPVSKGPFYALKAQDVSLSTLGGVRVNEKLEATDSNVKPISGLYVVGNDAAGFYSTPTYPPYQGLANGYAYNTGRIAGENAAHYVLGK